MAEHYTDESSNDHHRYESYESRDRQSFALIPLWRFWLPLW
jgi:hypothetical protein